MSVSEGEVAARHKKRSSAQGRATLPLTLEKLKELQAAASSHPKKKTRVAVEGEYEDEGSLAEELSEVLSAGEAAHAREAAWRVVPLLASGAGPQQPQPRGEVVRALFDRLRAAAAGAQQQQDSPELPLQDLRHTALALLHFALGGEAEAESRQHQHQADPQRRQLQRALATNRVLMDGGAYEVYVDYFCAAQRAVEAGQPQQGEGAAGEGATSAQGEASADADMRVYANLLLLLLISNSDHPDLPLLLVGNGQPQGLVYVLFDCLVDFGDRRHPHYPIKKVLLLLWKSVLYGWGGTAALGRRKEEERRRRGLPPLGPLDVKSSPAHLQALRQNVSQFRKSHTRLAMQASVYSSAGMPAALREAQRLVEHGLSPYSHPAHFPFDSDDTAGGQSEDGMDDDQPRGQRPTTSSVEAFYRAMLPRFRRVFIHLLNFLLALAPSDKRGAPPPFNLYAEIGDAGSVAQAAERARHEEIVVKAISGLLLLLLKHTRANHPIQAAYLQSLLVEAKMMLLILKLINQPESPLLTSPTLPAMELFVAESEQQALVEEDFGDGGLDGNGAALRYSKRKFFALVNFLRVLQKLAKYNHHRCLLLIKFSAPAILKRLLSFENPWIRLYGLKLIKNLTKFLGRKWRTSNMKVISEIYMHVRPLYMDDWLTTAFVENDSSSEFEEEERRMERKVREWNEVHYRRPLNGGATADGGEGEGGLMDEQHLAAEYAAGWLEAYFLHHALVVSNDLAEDTTPVDPAIPT